MLNFILEAKNFLEIVYMFFINTGAIKCSTLTLLTLTETERICTAQILLRLHNNPTGV